MDLACMGVRNHSLGQKSQCRAGTVYTVEQSRKLNPENRCHVSGGEKKNPIWRKRFRGAAFSQLHIVKNILDIMWVHHIPPWCLLLCSSCGPEPGGGSGSEQHQGTMPTQTGPSSGCWARLVHGVAPGEQNPFLLPSANSHPSVPPDHSWKQASCTSAAAGEAHHSKCWRQKLHTLRSPPGPWCRGCGGCLASPWWRHIKLAKDWKEELHSKMTWPSPQMADFSF